MEDRQIEKAPVSIASIARGAFEEENIKAFIGMLSKIDPELYLIKTTLMESQINPAIVPLFIKSLANVERGGGWGKVIIEIRDGVVERCASESTVRDSEVTKLNIIDLRNI